MTLSRRTFIIMGAAAAASPSLRAELPNEKITVGVMGVRGRGRFLAEYLASRPDTSVAWLCDVDESVLASCADATQKISGHRPKTTGDFRRILEDKEVHALFNATPDHWHAIPTIMACQAGKDVYVEKPASHNIFEGQQMVKAAREHKRVVQLGTQTRSGEYTAKALDYIRSGKLGKVHFIRVLNMKKMGGIGHREDEAVPKGVDYDMWLGPAPKRPFNPNRFHNGWNWFWDYSGGDLINDGIHQIDVARLFLGKDYPKSVVATGGKFGFNDDQECPDTMQVSVQYDDAVMSIESIGWTPYQTKVAPENRESTSYYPDWPFCGERIEVYGESGEMLFGRHGIGWQVYGPDGKVIADGNGPVPLIEHVNNFYACIKSRNRPTADIEEGHRSTLIAQLGNISYRLGGRRIEWNAENETISNDAQAQELTRRAPREPWVIG